MNNLARVIVTRLEERLNDDELRGIPRAVVVQLVVETMNTLAKHVTGRIENLDDNEAWVFCEGCGHGGEEEGGAFQVVPDEDGRLYFCGDCGATKEEVRPDVR